MTVQEKLEVFKIQLEDEYAADAIKVIPLYDLETRFVVVGIEHPLYNSFLTCGMILPRRGIDNYISLLYDECVNQLNTINLEVRKKYD